MDIRRIMRFGQQTCHTPAHFWRRIAILQCFVIITAYLCMILLASDMFSMTPFSVDTAYLNEMNIVHGNNNATLSLYGYNVGAHKMTDYRPIKMPIYNYHSACVSKQKPKWNRLVIDGHMNTGTNFAFKLIGKNCGHTFEAGRFYGKHKHTINDTIINETFHQPKTNRFDPSKWVGTLAVVLIKDPLTWIKSMCKAPYGLFYSKHCPTPINQSAVKWRRSNGNWSYPSIVHSWNDFYEHYINLVDQHYDRNVFDFIVVRYEDLLFDLVTTLKKICICLKHYDEKKYLKQRIDNLIFSDIKLVQNASKMHGNSLDYSHAMLQYGNVSYRFEKYSENDLLHVDKYVNHTILDMFHYQF
eukprot:402036_1